VDGGLTVDRRAFGENVRVWPAQRLVQQGGDLARDPQDAEAARQVGRQFDIEHNVAQDVLQGRAGPKTPVVLQQQDALVLVGAQAIYLHTGHADFAVAEYTTDADFCVAPAALTDAPLLPGLLEAQGFLPGEHPGAWLSPDGIPVDLMVPEALAGPGSRRGARLGPHGKRAARLAKGLEGAIVDRKLTTIPSLDPGTERSVTMLVAGPAALLVAKAHKIVERIGTDRVSDKDALDVLRLLQATETATLVAGLAQLAEDELSRAVAAEAVSLLAPLFGNPQAPGIGNGGSCGAPERRCGRGCRLIHGARRRSPRRHQPYRNGEPIGIRRERPSYVGCRDEGPPR